MTARKPKDEISRLLDSFQEEEVLEEKMEGFTAQKRRQDRMQRASRQTVEPEPVQNETNDTIVLRPEPKKTESAGTTVMFDPEKIAVGGGISEQPLLLQLIREELLKINGMYPWTLPVPEVTSCRFYNDANLIGAVYVHMKAREKKISLEKVNELMELLENRREGEYLRALLTE